MNLSALAAWLTANYDLPHSLECQLIRSYTNDVYLVLARDTRYVLKVYGRNWRVEEEVRYEVALMQHLIAGGLTAPAPIAGKDNDFVKSVTGENGDQRYAVLFSYALGEKPKPPFVPSLYVAFGEVIARMHELSSDFATTHTRRPLDLTLLLDDPWMLVTSLLPNADDRAFLTELVGRVKDGINAFKELDWGPIHGDATLDNLHVTTNGEVILFDFDSGGPGWRAADLQGWTVTSEEYHERGDAFREGYSRIRPLTQADIKAAPLFTLAWDIWGMKIDLENRILSQGRETVQTYLRDQITFLRERERLIRFPSPD